jgi:ABC-type uncharacterized transport system permease subunit
VSWLTDRHYFLLAVIAYGASTIYSVFLWRKGFRRDDRINYGLLLVGCVLHMLAMFARGFSLQHCPVNNLFEATMFIGWTIVATYLVLGLFPRLRFLGAFASPVLFILGVFALMPGLDVRGPKPEFTGGWLSLHVALSVLAYGAFGLSAVAGLMYLTQEHDLKFRKIRAVLSLLPPIQRLESVMRILVIAGFILLTVGLMVGARYFRENGGVALADPKVIWSLVVWLIYLGLIIAQWKFAQGGRRFAWGIIGSFIFVSLTFWGSSLMSPTHNAQKAKTSSGIQVHHVAFTDSSHTTRHSTPVPC